MTLAEIEHPIAQQLNTIVQASELGLADGAYIPDKMTIEHVLPYDSALGDHVISIYDRTTNNMSILRVPVFSDLDSGLTLQSKEDGELELTGVRILVSDMNGVTFKVRNKREEMPFSVPVVQFDVTDWGILFHARTRTGDKVKDHVGRYESDQYDIWTEKLRAMASIPAVYGAAIRHLADI